MHIRTIRLQFETKYDSEKTLQMHRNVNQQGEKSLHSNQIARLSGFVRENPRLSLF